MSDWATTQDTKDMCHDIDKLLTKFSRKIVMGDFNLPKVDWLANKWSDDSKEGALRLLAAEHGLSQMARQPTRQAAILDLVFASPSFCDISVTVVPPLANSDHYGQLISVALPSAAIQGNVYPQIKYEEVAQKLSCVDWPTAFASCKTTNELARTFMSIMNQAIFASTHQKR
jgi:hypothetical protein